ncbi:chromophore lyase CpcT/CpeT [Chamaesiphon sp. VAR_69_metabat_338]|uniref:chromophore lyase CpcT/CpeT n=1 Tax=Chamaesiphon sp. VAR_69_metabat_338 TaxID=2964704 RepID=UPI00286D7AC3|nr:chromophore lyase CpcT/CpeT [Chamaesiphon sp. VAR_69_metabat_338]
MTSVKNNDSILLCQWMAGDFSNRQQSFSQPQQFAHIHIFFRPLPFDFFNGIGFYSEQVYDHDLWTPYRQGIHRVVTRGDDIYIENYSLVDPIRYAGAARELSILKTISVNDIKPRQHCGMVFRREGEMFRGSVEPGNRCLIEKKGCMTYLISEVEITETTWFSLDRGMDIGTHAQVWGSTSGHLRFEKCQSFALELPLDRS